MQDILWGVAMICNLTFLKLQYKQVLHTLEVLLKYFLLFVIYTLGYIIVKLIRLSVKKM